MEPDCELETGAVTGLGNWTLHDLVERLQKSERKSINNSASRASVGVLIRRSPRSNAPIENCNAIIRSLPVNDLELFFILRSQREGDRWSGHVGFPGGRNESGESDLQAATREVLEEIGIGLPGLDANRFPDVDTSSFVYIGRLSDMQAISGKPGLVLCPFVFFQVTHETPSLVLSVDEVAAAGWSPLSQFMDDSCCDSFTVNQRMFDEEENFWRRLLFRTLALNRVWFPLIKLDIDFISLPDLNITSDDERSLEYIRSNFFCWGLTLQIIDNFLTETVKFRKRKIAVYESAFGLGKDIEKVFDFHLHNVAIHLTKRCLDRMRSDRIRYAAYSEIVSNVAIASSIAAILSLGILSRYRKRGNL